MVNMVCGAVTVKNGMTGRSCDATFQTSQRFGYVNFVSRAGFTVFASGQSRAGGDSINGGKGGLGARVSAKYVCRSPLFGAETGELTCNVVSRSREYFSIDPTGLLHSRSVSHPRGGQQPD